MTMASQVFSNPKLPELWSKYFAKKKEHRRNQNRWRTLHVHRSESSNLGDDISSNDYLNISAHLPGGAGSSPLVMGYHNAHDSLCREITNWTDYEDVRLFSSGYQANVGVIPSLTDEDSIIFSDELNHASIIDGCKLSDAERHIFPHRDMKMLAELLEQHRFVKTGKRSLIISETLFSMEGTFSDVDALRKLANRHQALLYLDEAHTMGVFGHTGAGYAREQRLSSDVFLCTFGKALGTAGAAICTSHVIAEHITNFCRSFIYSTGTFQNSVEQTQKNIQHIASQQGTLLRKKLHENIALFNRLCKNLGLIIGGDTRSPIRYLETKTDLEALDLADKLCRQNIHAIAIRPPTVMTPRIRIVLHTNTNVRDVCEKIAKLVE